MSSGSSEKGGEGNATDPSQKRQVSSAMSARIAAAANGGGGSSAAPAAASASSASSSSSSSAVAPIPLQPPALRFQSSASSGVASPMTPPPTATSPISGHALLSDGAQIDSSSRTGSARRHSDSAEDKPRVEMSPMNSKNSTPKKLTANTAATNSYAELPEAERIIATEADEIIRREILPAYADSVSSSSSSSSSPSDIPLLRYSTYATRLHSFLPDRWPHSSSTHSQSLSPAALAAAGFFRPDDNSSSKDAEAPHQPDTVICFSCGIELYDFEPDDTAMESHLQAVKDARKECDYLAAIQKVKREQGLAVGSGKAAGKSNPAPAASSSSSSSSSSWATASSSKPPARSSMDLQANPLLLMDFDQEYDNGDDGANSSSSSMVSPPGGMNTSNSSSSSQMTNSSGLPPSLIRTASLKEKERMELNETHEERGRYVRCSGGGVGGGDGGKSPSSASSSASSSTTPGSLLKPLSPSTPHHLSLTRTLTSPLIIQTRDPLPVFTVGQSQFVYFQMKVVARGAESRKKRPASANGVNGNDSAPRGMIADEDEVLPINASSSSSSSTPSYSSIILGLRSSPLNNTSTLPPGFDVTHFSDPLSIGLTSDGELYTGGMGPLSGIEAMENVKFWNGEETRGGEEKEGEVKPFAPSPVSSDAGAASSPSSPSSSNSSSPSSSSSSSTSTDFLRPSDILGCAYDLTRGLIYMHLNGKHMGPIKVGSGLGVGGVAEFKYYPTISLLHAGDIVEIETHQQSPSSSSSSQLTSQSSKDLHDAWLIPSSSSAYSSLYDSAVKLLGQYKPDLGLVLDQTNLARKGPPSAPGAPAATPNYGPVLISKIIPNSSADLAGLKVDDHLLQINGLTITKLQDAVGAVSKTPPGRVLGFEVRRGQTKLYLPLTLGAKGLVGNEFVAATRWVQFGEPMNASASSSSSSSASAPSFSSLFGPPASASGYTTPSIAGSFNAAPPNYANATAPIPAAGGASSSSSSSSSPQAPPPPSAIQNAEVTLLIEKRLNWSPVKAAIRAASGPNSIPLYLPQYQTMKERLQSYYKQMQAFNAAMMEIAIKKKKNGGFSGSPPSSSSSSLPPPLPTFMTLSPVNLSMHGLCYIPLSGVSLRFVCFACGSIITDVTNIDQALDKHRKEAKKSNTTTKNKLIANVSKAVDTYYEPPSEEEKRPALERQPSKFHPSNLDSGCLFLTLYDAAVAHLASKARTRASIVAQARAKRSSTVGRQSSAAPPGIDEVVIDMDGSGKGAASSSSSPASSPRGPPPPSYHTSSDLPVVAVGYAALASIAIVSDHNPHSGIIWQSPKQSGIAEARVGEFTHGSVDLPGRPQLSQETLAARNKGRVAPVMNAYGHANGNGNGYGNAAVGNANWHGNGIVGYGNNGYGNNNPPDAPPNVPYHIAPAAPQPPPEPERPPMEVLKEFFLGGNPIFLLCKVPFFILILPFFLVYECLKGIYNCTISCCNACTRLCDRCCKGCTRCCDWIADSCARCWNFICCTILCDTICEPFHACLVWIGRKLNEYIVQPLYRCMAAICNGLCRCIEAICSAISRCCRFVWESFVSCVKAICSAIGRCFACIDRVCCAPLRACISQCCAAIGRCCTAIGNALASCCLTICNALKACCDALGRCISATCAAIASCCRWFWTPIFNAITSVCKAIYSCIAYICNAIGRCITYVCTAIYECISAICSAISRCVTYVCTALYKCASAICTAIFDCFSWIFTQIGKCFRAIWSCITYVVTNICKCLNYVFVQPFIWICKQIWACISAVASAVWSAVSWVASGVWKCISAIASGVWTVLSAIGRGVWAVLSAIGRGVWIVLSAIGRGIAAVLKAIGSAIAAVFRAIYYGIFVPIGQAIASAGRAVKSLC